jgi:Ser/Thr protein kinase RdoA (MazF antagonist)
VKYVNQRINHLVFREPEKLMENIERVTRFARAKILAAGGDPDREALTIVPTRDGHSFHRTSEGTYWRMFRYIDGARTYDRVEDLRHVYSASKAFGNFQKMLAELPGERLHETIPNSGRIPERVTHNDTKLNNVMIDDRTGEGVCVIDLDTVMPGSILYDFGDSVRLGAATAAEDERDLDKVGFDLGLFDRLAAGYLDAARDFLVPAEADLLTFSAKLLTLECGIRFLTDHLKGDVYFKIHREGHNLDRCRTQLKMVSEMEKQMAAMDGVVRKYL